MEKIYFKFLHNLFVLQYNQYTTWYLTSSRQLALTIMLINLQLILKRKFCKFNLHKSDKTLSKNVGNQCLQGVV